MMQDYEELLRRVLRIVGDERRAEIEEEVGRRMAEDPRLTRLGALYIVASDLGVFSETRQSPPVVPLGKLVGGLSSVNVEARVIGLSPPRKGRAIYLRLGDSTGKVFATAWGKAAEMLTELGVKVGSAILVKNAYTREKSDGSVELHIGEQAELEIGGHGPPALESFFSEMTAMIGSGGVLDFKAYILGYSNLRTARVKGEESAVREILLGWDGVLVEMDLWRELAESFSPLIVGAKGLVAGARWSSDKITSSARTSIHIPGDGERLSFPLLYVSRQLSPEDSLASCGSWVFRVPSKNLKIGRSYRVEAFHFEKRGRAWIMVPDEYSEAEGAVSGPTPRRIVDLAPGMTEVYLEGEVASKSPRTSVETRRGEVGLLSFWLRDETGAIFCKAWGRAALEADRIAEGDRVAIAFAQVTKNPWGERELSLSESSYILSLVETP